MKVVFKQHLAIAQRGMTTAVCFAIHETSGAEHFTKYDEVLRYVDEYIASKNKPAVKYVTASELREMVLAIDRRLTTPARTTSRLYVMQHAVCYVVVACVLLNSYSFAAEPPDTKKAEALSIQLRDLLEKTR